MEDGFHASRRFTSIIVIYSWWWPEPVGRLLDWASVETACQLSGHNVGFHLACYAGFLISRDATSDCTNTLPLNIQLLTLPRADSTVHNTLTRGTYLLLRFNWKFCVAHHHKLLTANWNSDEPHQYAEEVSSQTRLDSTHFPSINLVGHLSTLMYSIANLTCL